MAISYLVGGKVVLFLNLAGGVVVAFSYLIGGAVGAYLYFLYIVEGEVIALL